MGRQKILIVEDDADISALLVKIMEGAGYQVRQAFSGTEALFCMERELPDCVLLDLMLPGMTGEEVLEQIRQEQKKRDACADLISESVSAGQGKAASAWR